MEREDFKNVAAQALAHPNLAGHPPGTCKGNGEKDGGAEGHL